MIIQDSYATIFEWTQFQEKFEKLNFLISFLIPARFIIYFLYVKFKKEILLLLWKLKKLTFNSFQENSYIISSNNECMIIDPGCCDDHEREILTNYINENNLIPKYLINTHCHLDHIFFLDL